MNGKGCIFLEKGIDFEANKVCDCCISHNDGRGLPVLIDNYNGEPINWDEIFAIKEKRIAAQKDKTIYECENCYHLNDYKFTGERKISDFHFSHCRACNANCIYCSDEQSKGGVNYDTYAIIKDLIDKGLYQSGGEATMQGGEPTLMQNFDELVHLFTENGTNVRVHTSAIKYSPTTAEALSQNKGTVVISLDSGCKETYKRIKNVDAFDIVCENISKYIQASQQNPQNVRIKYIIVPGVNDNIDEIDKFFNLMQKLGVKDIALDIEVSYARKYNNKDVSPHIFLLNDYFNKMANKLKINITIYSFLSYVLQNRNQKQTKLIDYKFLFKIYLNFKKDKTKDIIYRRGNC